MSRFISYVVVFVLGFAVCAWTFYYFFGSPGSFGPQSATDAPRTGIKLAAAGNNQVRKAAKVVEKYVVNIDTVGRPVRSRGPLGFPDFFGFPFERPDEVIPRGQASGVIMNPDGYIITNNHVVEGAAQLSVTLYDERRFPAKLIGRDPKTDLAVIKIDAHNLPYAKFANSNSLQVGDWVIAVGNALGLGPTVTIGLVSAKRTDFDIDGKVFEGVIQTDAAINRGNSGGALADINGNLVGINTAIASTNPGGGSIGIGFAIPSSTAKSIAEQLMKHGKVARPWLGISYGNLTDQTGTELASQGIGNLPKQEGAIIGQVVQGSPAARAGLQPFDVILKINGKSISVKKNPEKGKTTVAQAMQNVKVGDRITLEVWQVRTGKIANVGVIVGEMPAEYGN